MADIDATANAAEASAEVNNETLAGLEESGDLGELVVGAGLGDELSDDNNQRVDGLDSQVDDGGKARSTDLGKSTSLLEDDGALDAGDKGGDRLRESLNGLGAGGQGVGGGGDVSVESQRRDQRDGARDTDGAVLDGLDELASSANGTRASPRARDLLGARSSPRAGPRARAALRSSPRGLLGATVGTSPRARSTVGSSTGSGSSERSSSESGRGDRVLDSDHCSSSECESERRCLMLY